MVISGVANDENHIWNLVKLDDEKYYYIDCTWNDINGYFDYFCVGSDFFDIEHTKNSLENGSYDYLYELPEISKSDYKYPYEEYIVDGIKYNIYFEREAVVMGDTLNQSSIIIPDFVENKKVVSIDGAAFCHYN